MGLCHKSVLWAAAFACRKAVANSMLAGGAPARHSRARICSRACSSHLTLPAIGAAPWQAADGLPSCPQFIRAHCRISPSRDLVATSIHEILCRPLRSHPFSLRATSGHDGPPSSAREPAPARLAITLCPCFLPALARLYAPRLDRRHAR
ncbi:hypothetical protein FA95DRAFT_863035 [Auriscalpium vulgare]|uniref:Uncharacterized protein n=1 Tax=Auriscalpium vulgare TaxID=40419 RepID=A0ACB8S156_9AGAM|nr:hypothetical protein FA95DRAFT_863035 [Auriscalpium vulgare]